MQKAPSSITLAHHELRYGQTARVPRHLQHPLSGAVAKAIDAANQFRRFMPIDGTKFDLFADLHQQDDGNALCLIAAGTDLNREKLNSGTELYFGTVGTRFSTSVTAWRHVLRAYIATMISSPHGVTFSSFSAMPRDLPWAIGFMCKGAPALPPEDYNTLVTIARLTGLRLAELCDKASLAAERAGKDFTPDPANFPELA